MPEPLSVLVDDLEAERAAVDALLASLPGEAWDANSPADGWKLRDCVVHLAETDDSTSAIVEGVQQERGGEREGVLTAGMLRGRGMQPAEVLAWYRRAGERVLRALRGVGDNERLTWVGREMSARSFVTARLMEHWSHGLDIHDAAGVTPIDTDRLRHIALLGYLTREFAYRTRGMQAPSTPLYVELTSPSGDTWTYGPVDAPDCVFGPAGDFCRVVTQRIHPSDTELRAEGERAAEFLSIAQAFAGPPGSGRPPKGAPRKRRS